MGRRSQVQLQGWNRKLHVELLELRVKRECAPAIEWYGIGGGKAGVHFLLQYTGTALLRR